MHLHTVGGDIFHRAHLPAMVLAEIHHGSDEFLRRDDIGGDHRLDDLLDLPVREFAWIGDVVFAAILGGHLIGDVRRGLDKIEVELAAEAFRDDLHVEQAEEPTTEAESQRDRRFRRVYQRGIVELELVQCLSQFGELRVVDREQARIHHRFRITVTGKGFACGLECGSNGVAHLGLADILRSGDHIADLSGAKRLGRSHIRADHTDFNGIMCHADAHHVQFFTGVQLAVDHSDIRDDATVRVVYRVEDQSSCRRLRIAFGSGNVHNDLVEQIGHALACFARYAKHIGWFAADKAGDLLGVFVGLGARQINLVQHGNDGQIVVDGHVQVAQRLCLDALRGIDQQYGPFACGQRTGDLIGEVDMPGRIDHAKRIFLAVERPRHTHCLRFDGDATLLLDIHAIEEPVSHLAFRHDAAQLQNTIRNRRFTMIDMRDNAEVTNQRLICGTGLVVLNDHRICLLTNAQTSPSVAVRACFLFRPSRSRRAITIFSIPHAIL